MQRQKGHSHANGANVRFQKSPCGIGVFSHPIHMQPERLPFSSEVKQFTLALMLLLCFPLSSAAQHPPLIPLQNTIYYSPYDSQLFIYPWLVDKWMEALGKADCEEGKNGDLACQYQDTLGSLRMKANWTGKGSGKGQVQNEFGQPIARFVFGEGEKEPHYCKLSGFFDGNTEFLQLAHNLRSYAKPNVRKTQYWPANKVAVTEIYAGDKAQYRCIRYYDPVGHLLAYVGNVSDADLLKVEEANSLVPKPSIHQGAIQLQELEEHNGKYYVSGETEPFSGTTRDEHFHLQDHVLAMEYHFVNGLPHGDFAHFTTSGKPFVSGRFHNGKIVDSVIVRDIFENPLMWLHFENGKLHTLEEWGNSTFSIQNSALQTSKAQLEKSRYTYENVSDFFRIKPGLSQFGPELRFSHQVFLSQIEKWHCKRDSVLVARTVAKLLPEKRTTETWVYYPEGSLSQYYSTLNGLREGAGWEYHANGQLWFESFYKAGKKEGQHIVLSDSGKVVRQTDYLNGTKHGIEAHYYADGSQQLKINYQEGSPVGKQYHYRFQSEHYQQITEYFDGEKDFSETRFHPNGQKAYYRRLVNRKMEGTEISWFENGQMKSEGQYRKGEPYGTFYFYSVGNKQVGKINYDNHAQKNGLEIVAYDDGRPKSKLRYWHGIPIGDYELNHPNGAPAIRGQYHVGQRHGMWLHYSSTGEEIGREYYEYGVAIGDWTLLAPDGSFRLNSNYEVAGEHWAAVTFADGTSKVLWPVLQQPSIGHVQLGGIRAYMGEEGRVSGSVIYKSGEAAQNQHILMLEPRLGNRLPIRLSMNASNFYFSMEIPPGEYDLKINEENLFRQRLLGQITVLPGTETVLNLEIF